MNPVFKRRELERFLLEDLAHTEVSYDDPSSLVRATVVAEEDGVMCGGGLLIDTLSVLDPPERLTGTQHVPDGARFEKDAVLLEFETHPEAIRHGIRTGLNLLQRLCGIATQTAKLVKAVEGTGCKLLDTRKTTPGLRAFEKYAVRCGGGHSHRFGRFDGVIIKKEDIVIDGGVTGAIDRALRHVGHLSCVEVEVETLKELDAVIADRRVHHVMLDNMEPDMALVALQLSRPHGLVVEVSGVAPSRLRDYAALGVPFISTSALILGAKPTKLHLVPVR